MILKNKLCRSAARLGRGFQTRPKKGHSSCYFTEITEWNLNKNTLSRTVSFEHPRLCLKLRKIYNKKNHIWDVLTRGRFDQFLGTSQQTCL